MPDVFVYVSKEDADRLRSYFIPGELIPRKLREATAKALPDLSGPQDVEVRLMEFVTSDNATRIQIFCVASKTTERAPHVEKYLHAWAEELANAWKEILSTPHFGWLAEDFPLTKVGIWPTMPDGQWHLAIEF